MKNKIDIICYYDTLHKNLFDLFFYSSYKKYLINNFNLIEHYFSTDPNTESSWYSEHWSKTLINRFDIIKDYIKCNTNKWCIFSDVDILFFENFYKDIKIYLESDLHDIYYMPEFIRAPINIVNGGFFLFKCNNKIYDYFCLVQEKTKSMTEPNDQISIQELLKTNNIKYSILHRSIFVTNNNPRNKILYLLNNNIMKVFHATCTGNVIEKMQVLSTVYIKKYNPIGNCLWIPPEV